MASTSVCHLSDGFSSRGGSAQRSPRSQHSVSRICVRIIDPPYQAASKLRATIWRNVNELKPVTRFQAPYRCGRAGAATAVAKVSRPHRMLSGLRKVRRSASRLCRLDEPVRVSSRPLGSIRAAHTALISLDCGRQADFIGMLRQISLSPLQAGKTTAGVEPLVYRVQRTRAAIRTKRRRCWEVPCGSRDAAGGDRGQKR